MNQKSVTHRHWPALKANGVHRCRQPGQTRTSASPNPPCERDSRGPLTDMPLNICDWCGYRHPDRYCGECGLLLCPAHKECPECGRENMALFREDQNFGPPDAGAGGDETLYTRELHTAPTTGGLSGRPRSRWWRQRRRLAPAAVVRSDSGFSWYARSQQDKAPAAHPGVTQSDAASVPSLLSSSLRG
jgi:hypothetical protein